MIHIYVKSDVKISYKISKIMIKGFYPSDLIENSRLITFYVKFFVLTQSVFYTKKLWFCILMLKVFASIS